MSWTRQTIKDTADSPARRPSESTGIEAVKPPRPDSPLRSNVNIGPSIQIEGTVTGSEDLVIDGTVEGQIHLDQHALTVGEHGVIRADVSAKAIHVNGKVTGNLTATDKIEIASSGSVKGDLHAPQVALHDGARFNGSVDMGERREASERKIEKPSSTPAATRPAAAAG